MEEVTFLKQLHTFLLVPIYTYMIFGSFSQFEFMEPYNFEIAWCLQEMKPGMSSYRVGWPSLAVYTYVTFVGIETFQ